MEFDLSSEPEVVQQMAGHGLQVCDLVKGWPLIAGIEIKRCVPKALA